MTYGLLKLLAARDGGQPFNPFFPPPADMNGDDSDGQLSDDDSDYEDGRYGSPPPAGSPSYSTGGQRLSLISPTTSLIYPTTESSYTSTSTTLSTQTGISRSSTAIPTGTFPSSTASTSTTGLPAPTIAQPDRQPFNDPSSIPQNEADPALETKAGASPLGTAGIVLAAVFGFVAVATMTYFVFRTFRRRRQSRDLSDDVLEWPPQKPNSSSWRSTTQETGIIFGRRSRSPHDTRWYESPIESGRFSFLNRRWYSTGSQVTRSRPPSQESTPRWYGTLFGLGFISSPSAKSVWFKSDSSEASDDLPQHRTINEVMGVERNVSQSSTGEGHARAYAHHKVRAPVRSTISSLASKRLKRRSERNSGVSEMSEMYDGSPGPTSGRSSISRDSRVVRESMPRLPLPVVFSPTIKL